jgi:hypothetical protein
LLAPNEADGETEKTEGQNLAEPNRLSKFKTRDLAASIVQSPVFNWKASGTLQMHLLSRIVFALSSGLPAIY